jgi:hypothetical protein
MTLEDQYIEMAKIAIEKAGEVTSLLKQLAATQAQLADTINLVRNLWRSCVDPDYFLPPAEASRICEIIGNQDTTGMTGNDRSMV